MGRITRIPSIHITSNHLGSILEQVVDSGLISIKYSKATTMEDLVNEICRLASLNPCHHRNIEVSNKKTEKKVQRFSGVSKVDALLLSRTITMVRKNLRHRGISMINQSSKEWPTIQLIAKHATDFCNENNLKPNDGYMIYVKIGISRMTTYSLVKFPKLHETICLAYNAEAELANDSYQDITKRLISRYKDIVMQKTQIPITYLEDFPEKRVLFKRAAEQCVQYGATPEDYIEAQFEALAFVSGIPGPEQIVGPKAIERLAKYMFEKLLVIAKL